jgi:hypothetical protein
MTPNVRVIFRNKNEDVIPLLKKMKKYLAKTPTDLYLSVPYAEEVQRHCKKRKMTCAKDIFVEQLCCIHGMTKPKAEAIVNSGYNCFADMSAAYLALPHISDRVALFKDLVIPNSKKKLGKVLSCLLYDSTMNHVSSTDPELQCKKRAKKIKTI